MAFFVVKPVYTLLALLIVVLLWKQSASDLAALRWGMLFFFLGENACAANYLLFRGDVLLVRVPALPGHAAVFQFRDVRDL